MTSEIGSRIYRVTNRNVDLLIPIDVQNLIFSWCHDAQTQQVVPSQLRSTLTKLEFRGYTRFTNIQSLLVSCENLQVLEFSTIGLSHYPGTEGLEHVDLLNLQELRFRGNGPLTQHELQLFEYFSEKITFPAVRTLTLIDGAGFQAAGERNNFSNYLHPSLLIGWLIQNCKTLQTLEARRSGVILAPSEDPDISKLQLDKFIMRANTVGSHYILNAQRNLQILGYLKSSGTRPSKSQLVMDYIEKSGSTLKEITFEHKVLHTLDDMRLGNTPDAEAHDCRIYLDCRKLQVLSIESSLLEDPERRQRRPGTIKNLSFLPLSLSKLEIKVDHMRDQDELRCLEILLPKMSNLKDFHMRGNMNSPFQVGLSLIETLMAMKALSVFELKFCYIDDFPKILQYVQTKPEYKSVILLSPNAVSCRKGADESE